jgi:protein-tyrosine-phosphatase
MTTPQYNVLFVCTGNSARSQMAEALTTVLSKGRIKGFSAGSHPTGAVHPKALQLIEELGYPIENLRSKNWMAFAGPDAPRMDFIITVCDSAAGETCPIWPGHPAVAHWGVPDPVASGDAHAFKEAWLTLRRRIELLLALPLEKLDSLARVQQLREIALQDQEADA